MPEASPHSSSEASRDRSRRRGIVLLIGAILILVLAAGVLMLLQSDWFQTQDRAPVSPEPVPVPEVPEEEVRFLPDGTAEENLPYFEQTLAGFAAGELPVEGVPIVDAVSAAGFDRSQMQVSFDRSQTNLVADNIFVSVRVGEQCLIGQVVTGTREVAAVVEDAVGPDADICLIGNTRAIDW